MIVIRKTFENYILKNQNTHLYKIRARMHMCVCVSKYIIHKIINKILNFDMNYRSSKVNYF